MSVVGDKSDIQQLIAAGQEGLARGGRMPAGLVANAELHALEAERVFGRCWQFLAHETEVPQAGGDYVVRYLGGGSIIVVRGEDGEVRAMANSCRHRGTLLCRTEMGNTSHFRCPYHGWTYRNTGALAGVPAQEEVYGVEMDKNEWSLTQVPRLENYGGLIFGCLDENAPPLADYLGDMTWYLDLISKKKTQGGLEVRGEPQRWIIDSNWKLGADNFCRGGRLPHVDDAPFGGGTGSGAARSEIRVAARPYQPLQRSRAWRPRCATGSTNAALYELSARGRRRARRGLRRPGPGRYSAGGDGLHPRNGLSQPFFPQRPHR